jgi:hypothetical protein
MNIITDINQLKELIGIAQYHAYDETEPEEIIEEWLSQIKTNNQKTKP